MTIITLLMDIKQDLGQLTGTVDMMRESVEQIPVLQSELTLIQGKFEGVCIALSKSGVDVGITNVAGDFQGNAAGGDVNG